LAAAEAARLVRW